MNDRRLMNAKMEIWKEQLRNSEEESLLPYMGKARAGVLEKWHSMNKAEVSQ